MLKSVGRGKFWVGLGLSWLSLGLLLLTACGEATPTAPAATAPATTAASNTSGANPATTTAGTTSAVNPAATTAISSPVAATVQAATTAAPPAGQNIQVQLNTPFQLRPGRTALLKQENFSIEFLGVTADSRCPQGANCIRAGEVTVQVRLKKDSDVATATMTLPGQNQNRQYASLGALGVELLGVNPRPRLDAATPGATVPAINPGDYSIDLVVRPTA